MTDNNSFTEEDRAYHQANIVYTVMYWGIAIRNRNTQYNPHLYYVSKCSVFIFSTYIYQKYNGSNTQREIQLVQHHSSNTMREIQWGWIYCS